MSVVERLAEFIEYKDVSMLSFERSIGTRSTISKAIANNKDISVSWIEEIARVYPEINLEWLITGVGDMIKCKTVREQKVHRLKKIEKIVDSKLVDVTRILKETLLTSILEEIDSEINDTKQKIK